MLTSINSLILFAIWGMDILGPFPIASPQRKFLIAAIDCFTKWIEAKPSAKITTKQVMHFWKSVICRCEIPRILVTDNGTQFNNDEFKKYCEENDIQSRFTSVTHPQADGQAEVANWIIRNGLKGWNPMNLRHSVQTPSFDMLNVRLEAEIRSQVSKKTSIISMKS